MTDDRLDRERVFYNAQTEESLIETSKFYSVLPASRQRFVDYLTQRCTGKRVLEYGCGHNCYAILLAQHGAHVTGIDLSEAAIEQSKFDAIKAGVEAGFQCMNAENLTFPAHSFDIICGTAILHHLDIEKSYEEIARTLKSNGVAVFQEPLGHNFLINWYRNRTPHLRTVDEHPLLAADLRLAGRYFKRTEFDYHHLTSLAAVPIRKTSLFEPIRRSLETFDQLMFSLIPPIRYQAWMVTMRLFDPIGA